MIPIINKSSLLVAALLAMVAGGCLNKKPAHDSACVRDLCFRLEVADSPEEHAQGLMHRTQLDKDSGMLFIFTYRFRHAFWMKNTLIPLDMIWFDHALRVVHIEENVPPCQADPCPSYAPRQEALYVLELNAGTAREKEIKLGDQFTFTIDLDNKEK